MSASMTGLSLALADALERFEIDVQRSFEILQVLFKIAKALQVKVKDLFPGEL